MLRLFRSARGILPSSRLASQIQNGNTVVLHRVRLNRPGVRLRNVLISGAAFFGCYAIYSSVVISPLIQWADAQEDQLTPEERKELEEEEPLFIAFPFTTKVTHPPPYAGSSPEWAAFVRLSRDEELKRAVRATMAKIVRDVARNSVPLSRQCGNDLKIKNYWINLDFPFRPPPVYERSGILITDDEIEWTSRPVESATVLRTRRILWPSPLFLSTWAFAGSLFKQNLFDLAKLLGYDSNRPDDLRPAAPPQSTAGAGAGASETPGNAPALPPSHRPDIEKALQQIRKQATKRPEEVKDPRAMASQNQQQQQHNTPPSSSSSSTSSPPTPPDSRTPAGTPKGRGAATAAGDGETATGPVTGPEALFPGHETLRTATTGPWQAFKRRYAQLWRPMRDFPPSGSVLVSGLVELEGSRASVVIDVIAWWDPRRRRFDERSAYLQIRRIRVKNAPPPGLRPPPRQSA